MPFTSFCLQNVDTTCEYPDKFASSSFITLEARTELKNSKKKFEVIGGAKFWSKDLSISHSTLKSCDVNSGGFD